MEKEMVIVLDFGGQYNQLIARRVRECNVYCEVHPYSMSLEKIKELNPKGIYVFEPNGEILQNAPRRFSSLVFLFWEFVMARSFLLICLEAV